MKITAITQQQKRADRYSIFVDGKYAFSLSESGLIESRLVSGQELTVAELTALKKTAGLDKAYGLALRYVAIRPRSEGELADYFRRKQVETSDAEQIMQRLRSFGLVDDMAFAKAWVTNRRLLKSVSKRRLRQELQQKRVASDIIDGALQDDEADDRQALRELIEKKQHRYPDKQKFMQYLARQGFSYDDIKSALTKAQES
ncbi:MAG TPA: RecX family transcriptional regulator [Candidatus Saccharimonadales bacterium]|nr:RecX family transcriptional regulator [Candidatus Saccharimonadales bacterium]